MRINGRQEDLQAVEATIFSGGRRDLIGPERATHVQEHCTQQGSAPSSEYQVTRQCGLTHVLGCMSQRHDEHFESRQLAAPRMLKLLCEHAGWQLFEALTQCRSELTPPISNDRNGQILVHELNGVISANAPAEQQAEHVSSALAWECQASANRLLALGAGGRQWASSSVKPSRQSTIRSIDRHRKPAVAAVAQGPSCTVSTLSPV